MASLALRPLTTNAAETVDGTACANLNDNAGFFPSFTTIPVGKKNAKEWYKEIGAYGNQDAGGQTTLANIDGDGLSSRAPASRT